MAWTAAMRIERERRLQEPRRTTERQVRRQAGVDGIAIHGLGLRSGLRWTEMPTPRPGTLSPGLVAPFIQSK